MRNRFTAQFERYLGRSLDGYEERIITPLERMRHRTLQRRIVVVDGPRHDSRRLLCDYVRFLHHINGRNAVIVGRTAAEAKEQCDYRRGRDFGWLGLGTSRAPENLRGRTFSYILFLDADTWRPSDFNAAFASNISVLPVDGECFCIVHCRRLDIMFHHPLYQRYEKCGQSTETYKKQHLNIQKTDSPYPQIYEIRLSGNAPAFVIHNSAFSDYLCI